MNKPLRLLCYSTGHGFGHASRDIQVLSAVHSLNPDAVLHLRTPVLEWFVRYALGAVPCERSEARLDVGIVQADGLHQDVPGTLARCRELMTRHDELVAGEVEFMREWQPSVVLCDIPAIPLIAARRLGIPAVAMGNFSWDWIYEGLIGEEPGFAAVRDCFAAGYGEADVYLRLPFHGGDEASRAFAVVVDVPMVSRASRLPIAEARELLWLSHDRPCVLISFGGFGPAEFDWARLGQEPLTDYQFVLTPPISHTIGKAPENVRVLGDSDLQKHGLVYPDLVRACDVVVTKPGYGIVSECLANETRVLYTSRGAFAEYPFLVEGLEKYGTAEFISNEDLMAGHWEAALKRLLARPRPTCALAWDGAFVVARKLTALGAGEATA
jgi:L-arabinokinase